LIEDEQTGVLVQSADTVELAQGIIRLIKRLDPERIGKAARQRVLEYFTWDKIAARTVDFYRLIQKLP